jgi:hypothetical protein
VLLGESISGHLLVTIGLSYIKKKVGLVKPISCLRMKDHFLTVEYFEWRIVALCRMFGFYFQRLVCLFDRALGLAQAASHQFLTTGTRDEPRCSPSGSYVEQSDIEQVYL